jgi:hypothetical protein
MNFDGALWFEDMQLRQNSNVQPLYWVMTKASLDKSKKSNQ